MNLERGAAGGGAQLPTVGRTLSVYRRSRRRSCTSTVCRRSGLTRRSPTPDLVLFRRKVARVVSTAFRRSLEVASVLMEPDAVPFQSGDLVADPVDLQR